MVGETFTQDGVRIAYEHCGRGMDLVLLHGLSDDRRVWDEVSTNLARDHRVVRLDFRGHGNSESAASATLDDLVEDVHSVVRALEIQEPVLIGHSLGGAVATAYAGSYAVTGVVNIDQPMRFAMLAAIARTLEKGLRGPDFRTSLWAIAEAMGVGTVPAALRAMLHDNRQRVSQALVLSIWEPFFRDTDRQLDERSEALVNVVRVPYLAIHGAAQDSDYHDWLSRHMPNAIVETWEGCGHWVQLVQPDAIAERTRALIQGSAK